VAIVEFLGHMHSLKTILGGTMVHMVGDRGMEVEIFGESMVEEVSNVGE